MKLTFLGTGSAFTVGADNFQSNMVLENDQGKRLLIDCGSDVRWSLHAVGLSYKDIDAVYISHLHADHTGGLEWLAFTRYFDKTCTKPTLYISENQAHTLWNKVLAGGLSSVEGKISDLSTYFHVKTIPENSYFTWSGVEFKIVQTMHVVSGFTIVPCFGLLFTVNDKSIFITTDTQFAPHQLLDFYAMADIIFHDCETTKFKSRVHAHYEELISLDPSLKKKIWLYHYNPGPLPDAVNDGFQGFVKKGQVFQF